jgi:hypothetical protein
MGLKNEARKSAASSCSLKRFAQQRDLARDRTGGDIGVAVADEETVIEMDHPRLQAQ